MKIIVRGKNIELTEGIESKINKKLNMLDKYFIMSDNVEAKVLIRTYPLGQKIEVTIPTEYVLLRAEVVDQDLYNAIDLVIDKLEGQIRKAKTKKEKMMKDASLKTMEVVTDKVSEIKDEIVKTSYYEIKPITPEDAVLELQSKPTHNFLAFINVETGKVNVVHKLKDGKTYGLVEPEA